MLLRPDIDASRAVAIARDAQPRYAAEQVLRAELGTFASLGDPHAAVTPPAPDPAAAVWRITLGWQLGPLTGQGVDVVVDASSGRVLQVVEWIS